MLHLVCCFLGRGLVVLEEARSWSVFRDSLIARDKRGREGDLNRMGQDMHAQGITEDGCQLDGDLGSSVPAISNEHDGLVSPFPVQMVERIFELAWDAPVVLRRKNDEPVAGRDERAPFSHRGRRIQGGIANLGRQEVSVDHRPEWMGRAGDIDGDDVELVLQVALRVVETTCEDIGEPRSEAFAIARDAGAPRDYSNLRHSDRNNETIHVVVC